MGEYLATPKKEKISTDDENDYIKYGACGMQGWRKHMEDAHISNLSIGNTHCDLFGVFDGHGGGEVAQFVKNHFAEELIKNPNFTNSDNIKLALEQTFKKMDELLSKEEGKVELRKIQLKIQESESINDNNQNIPHDERIEEYKHQSEIVSKLLGINQLEEDISMMTGCTCCVCLLDHIENKAYFCNVGDSRVVLCKNGQAIQKSVDHKPNIENEKNRIVIAGGWITDGRIKGNLNLSRCIGDLEYKQNPQFEWDQQMLICKPDIVVENIDKDFNFIVIACDGVWDCMTNKEICDYFNSQISKTALGQGGEKISKPIEGLFDNIISKDIYNETGIGCDNMTCIVVHFK